MRNTAVMSVGTTLSRVTGFMRVFVAAAVLGIGLLADTYNRANTTPNIVYELVLGGILTSVFIPVFVEWLQTHGEEEAFELVRRVLTLALVVLVGVAILGVVFAEPIIRLYMRDSRSPNQAGQIALGVFFLRWFMPQIVFYGVGAVAIGLLNTYGRFAIGMFAPILNNAVVILTLGVYGWMLHGAPPTIDGITAAEKLVLALGTTLGVVAMTVALWPSLHAIGFRWRWRFDLRHPAVRRLGKLAMWVVVYVAANQAAYLIVIILAAGMDTGIDRGAFTTYLYAFVLFQLPYAIFGVSIFTALVPGMSGRWAAGDREGVSTLLSKGLRTTAAILLPAAAGYLALAVPIAVVVFRHGHTTLADAILLGRTLQAFSLGLVFFALFQLLSRTFYAMQDTRTPALVNVAAATVNIGADLLFTKRFGWGVQGLALGHAASYIFSTAVCLVILHRRLSGLDGGRIGNTLVRVVPLAAVTGLVAWGAAHLVGAATFLQRLAGLGLGVAAGLLVFLGGSLILQIEEADELRSVVLRRLGR